MPKKSVSSINPIKLDLDNAYLSTIIAFGSLQLKKTVPHFEWTHFLSKIPAKKIYVRDLNQLWYLRGLPGIGTSPEEVSDHLRQILTAQKTEKIITIGTSMGGYAALLFGHLLQADEVHAFAIQSFLPTRKGLFLARTVRDRKWSLLKKQWELRFDGSLNRRFFDLYTLLKQSNDQTKYHIYFSYENKLDRAHAHYIQSLPNVEVHERVDEGHIVAATMRKSGELKEILMKAISLEETAKRRLYSHG